MQLALKSSLLAAACLILNAHALPRPVVTYSVVNVDGGSQTTPTPTVVYETITKSEDTPATISVTMTVVVTDHTTLWTHAQATETALIPEVSAQPEGSPTRHVPVPVAHPTEDSTVTVVSVVTPTPTTTKYYDNGQWHTSYAIKDFSSAGESHPGQWTPSASAVSAAAIASSSWQASGSAAPSGYSSSYGLNSSASY
jgi:hypothetical protein